MSEYTVTDPSSGLVVAHYPTASAQEVEQALVDVQAAFLDWSQNSTVAERASMLHRVAELHRERREHLAQIIVLEMGKIYDVALGEVDFAADIIDYYATVSPAHAKEQQIELAEGSTGTAVIRRAALGPLLGIMPWNFPYYQVARFAAPNIANGNPVIIKHAPQCPQSAQAIADIYRAAGFPEGVYVNLRASNEQSAQIIADRRIQGVSLTGSERAGSAVAEVAGRHLKKVALELGGSDPFILLSTHNMAEVVDAAVAARLDNSGQACNGAKRFIIIDHLYDEFLAQFLVGLREAVMGPPQEPNVVLGPLASEQAARNLQGQIEAAVAQGAVLELGGQRQGAYFEATVLTGVTDEMSVYREELFGPAAVVYRAIDEADAIRIANDTDFGLGSYVFTTDAAQAQRVADQLQVGMVYVNIVLADSPELPFGGVKNSGTGRELGTLALDEFVNRKLIRIGH